MESEGGEKESGTHNRLSGRNKRGVTSNDGCRFTIAGYNRRPEIGSRTSILGLALAKSGSRPINLSSGEEEPDTRIQRERERSVYFAPTTAVNEPG